MAFQEAKRAQNFQLFGLSFDVWPQNVIAIQNFMLISCCTCER